MNLNRFDFFETIKIKNGKIQHIAWHQKRIEETCEAFYSKKNRWNLSELIPPLPLESNEIYKFNFYYNASDFDTQLSIYKKKKIQNFIYLQTDYKYPYKSCNRQFFNDLSKTETEYIFTQSGNITDTTYSNLAFFDGDKWWTPDSCLLNGTTRQRLIHENQLRVKSIKRKDLNEFKKFCLINAMLDLDELSFEINFILEKA